MKTFLKKKEEFLTAFKYSISFFTFNTLELNMH